MVNPVSSMTSRISSPLDLDHYSWSMGFVETQNEGVPGVYLIYDFRPVAQVFEKVLKSSKGKELCDKLKCCLKHQ